MQHSFLQDTIFKKIFADFLKELEEEIHCLIRLIDRTSQDLRPVAGYWKVLKQLFTDK